MLIYPRIVIMGPPGSGKNTQAETLALQLGVAHISTGDILRTEIELHTPLGLRIATSMDAGHLIGDADMELVVRHRLCLADCDQGWILNGYPRRLTQALTLDRFAHPNFVIIMNLSDEEVMRRLTGRRVCRDGHAFHLEFHPPQYEGLCDADGLPLTVRQDDEPSAVLTRLAEYRADTVPVRNHYIQGMVTPYVLINGYLPIDTIAAMIAKRCAERPWLQAEQ